MQISTIKLKLKKSDISMLLSLVSILMERYGDTKDYTPNNQERLMRIRNRLLAMLTTGREN